MSPPQVTTPSASSPVPNSMPQEPIAIIGIGCNYPGNVTGPAAYWDLLCSGTDATTQTPKDRWALEKFYDPDPRKPGKTSTCRGGYLEGIDLFDAAFFGISPREAGWMDPQQRLLLKTTWEALQDAGLVPSALAGRSVGVFMGGFTLDYHVLQNLTQLARYQLEAHTAAGIMMTMLSNRISHVFDFQGPSVSIDTACSGSLVAVHLACQSLSNGECELAICGGANIMLVPSLYVVETKGGFLAADGRCKTFTSKADGYSRGEGTGAMVLKPLSAALRDGESIYALIRGTAVTQDGRTGTITAPSEAAQVRAIRQAQERAGIAPSEVQYVEAHGTGTPIGDPTEARAIGTVLSEGRPAEERCLIGSVKPNIGHLEGAAGIAGISKVALSLAHRKIPPHLLHGELNPDIPFDELRVRVPTTVEPWPGAGPARAGVNSFGFGGTNAHAVLEEAPGVKPRATEVLQGLDAPAAPLLLPVSARNQRALQASAERLRDFLMKPAAPLADVAYSSALKREHHEYRATFVARSKQEAISKLDAWLASNAASAVTSVPRERPKLAFVCSGMGPQWWGMARELLEREPVFRYEVERCDASLRRFSDWSLLDELCAEQDASRMDRTEIAQPANFAVQVGLAKLFQSWGIEPDAIVGHSAGEVASQYLSGALSWDDAVRVIHYRSALQQTTTQNERVMLAAGLSADSLLRIVEDRPELASQVSIAAINSPESATLAGTTEALESVARQLEVAGAFHRFLDVRVPYHSHFMDPIRAELESELSELKPRTSRIPLYSTVTGTLIDGAGIDARYWWQNVRSTVLFSAAASQMIADGYTHFLELSPHPVLAHSIRQVLTSAGSDGTVISTLRRKESDSESTREALGALHCAGHSPDWKAVLPEEARFVRLPTYPWQEKRHWAEPVRIRSILEYHPLHPLLGEFIDGTLPTWELELNTTNLPYLTDHRIQGNALMPGAAYVELALAAAQQTFGEGSFSVENLEFAKALFLNDAADARLRVVLDPKTTQLNIYSRVPGVETHWNHHCSATLRKRVPGSSSRVTPLAATETPLAALSGAELYLQLQQSGFDYGPAFQGVDQVETSPGHASGTLKAPAAVGDDLGQYHFHPALLDAAFQVLLAIRAGAPSSDAEAGEVTPMLPVAVDHVEVLGRAQPQMQVRARISPAEDGTLVGDLQIFGADDQLLVNLQGFRARSLESARSTSAEAIDRLLYEVEWVPHESPGANDSGPGANDGTWLILSEPSPLQKELSAVLYRRNIPHVTVSAGAQAELTGGDGHYSLNARVEGQFAGLVERLQAEGYPASTKVLFLWGMAPMQSAASSTNATSPTEVAPESAASPAASAQSAGLAQTLDHLVAAQDRGSKALLALVKQLAQTNVAAQLWVVTRGVHVVPVVGTASSNAAVSDSAISGGATPNATTTSAVGSSSTSLALEQAPLWGMARLIGHQEHRNLWGGLVDLAPAPSGDEAERLFEAIKQPNGEDQLALRAGALWAARLVPSPRLSAPMPLRLDPDVAYLVTGGLGSLGLLTAEWLANHGAKSLILTGRRALVPREQWSTLADDHAQKASVAKLEQLAAAGVNVEYAAVDVADAAQLNAYLDAYRERGAAPIRGVIHSAGVVDDELAVRMDEERFDRAMYPKLCGGMNLHRAFEHEALDFFILFSSIASVMPSVGQANYAAGNSFLDALAQHRRQLGLPALSVGWGPWAIGMVDRLNLEERYTRQGMQLITEEVGTKVLSRILDQQPAHLIVCGVDWAKAQAASPWPELPPLFSSLLQRHEVRPTDNPADAALLLQQIRDTKPEERQSMIESLLQDMLVQVLQLDPAQFDRSEALPNLGVDSMMAMELKYRIDAMLQTSISVLDLLQPNSVQALAANLLPTLNLDSEEPAKEAELTQAELDDLVAQTDSDELEALLAALEGNVEA